MATPQKFTMTEFRRPVDVVLAPNITAEQLEKWPAFKTWRTTLWSNLELQYTDSEHDFKDDPYLLKSVLIQSVDWFGRRVGFLKLKAVIRNSKGTELPGIAFLRGGSVAMLMILRPKDSRDERWVVLTEQPRVPAGSLKFVEIPAGMIDEEEKFSGAAAKEIFEETGFTLPESELVDLTELALRRSVMSEPSMKNAMYPSPGGSDEFMPIFLWEKELDRQEIEDLRGKLTGEKRQGEMITLRVVGYEDLWREGARDAKTLAAWALYEGLNREGAIKQELDRRKEELNDTVSIEYDDSGEGTAAGTQEEDLIAKRQCDPDVAHAD
ncbi:uncharacterized protein M421DRAFT_421038 [Didymella exigua CBS 183.55]|uniref:Nudix hydrolase domain-containing protein n=1 Tax=Didymella exigua CBS 183.55 TaxID=1150837 RepID=A0A6A5RK53_9PLEO|nr:uncharacterized protein M421DRAFT_421038 [Didymella exigua CBS 183.55]KAF1927843.1 hypothetical protein M421DRAFT_421038 [Didymella exigua CBS 183.55]